MSQDINTAIALNVMPLTSNIAFENLGIKSKKPAKIDFDIEPDNSTIILRSNQGSTGVVGYQSPFTGLFVCDDALKRQQITDSKDICKSTFDLFRKDVKHELSDAFKIKMKQLKALHDRDPQKYKDSYKPLTKISSEVTTYLKRSKYLYSDINKSLRFVSTRIMPTYNSKLIFKDDDFTASHLNTNRRPYRNPAKAKQMQASQKKLVDNFFDIFFDDENKRRFYWYFGAVLANQKISDKKINKMMILTSDTGGTGKSTLVNTLSKVLLSPEYCVSINSFDQVFSKRDHFSLSMLKPGRLTVFDEAEFNDDPTSENHDFRGLQLSRIKSLITEGTINTERKFENSSDNRLDNLMIVLTNHLPTISSDDQAINRRILECHMKSTSMIDKGATLGLTSQSDFEGYIKDHVQAFANVMTLFYLHHQTLYTKVAYDAKDSHQDIRDDAMQTHKTEVKNVEYVQKLSNEDPVKALRYVGQKNDLNLETLIQMAVSAINGNDIKDFVRYKKGRLYISSKKAFLAGVANDASARKTLMNYFGQPVKKFGANYFEL